MHSISDIEFLSRTQLYRPLRKKIDVSLSARPWAQSIETMLAAGYSFHPCCYDQEGYLFRGMPSGFMRDAVGGRFGHFESDNEMSDVEKAMGVYFLSNEISDAVSISRLHDYPNDAAILAIRASAFNDCLERYEAAILAVGDGGMVFRYPFLTSPVPEVAVDRIFVSAPLQTAEIPAGIRDRCIHTNNGTRKELEIALQEKMDCLGMKPASTIHSRLYPKRNQRNPEETQS